MKTPHFTEDQIIQLLREAKKSEKPTLDLCRDFGCSPAPYHGWKKKYGDTTLDKSRRRLGQNSPRMGLGRFVNSSKENARLLEWPASFEPQELVQARCEGPCLGLAALVLSRIPHGPLDDQHNC